MNRADDTRDDDGFRWSAKANEIRQLRLGMAMTPAERLRWLEETVAEMRKIQGKARESRDSLTERRPADGPRS